MWEPIDITSLQYKNDNQVKKTKSKATKSEKKTEQKAEERKTKKNLEFSDGQKEYGT